jgi:hypothetical protein
MKFLTTLALLLLHSATLLAQALPLLPSDPAQAPLDGGLLFTAAAGGAYVWRKLRNKKN